MTWRLDLSKIIIVAVACAFCLSAVANAEPPNIVVIISDDQFADDFGFMGNPYVQTPHLDQLAAKSARFVNGSVPSSVCSPSLATLLTGLYPHQHGIHYNHPPPGNAAFNKMSSRAEYEKLRSRGFQLIQQVDTLPRLLRDELNYRSFQTGKFWEGHYSNAGFTDGMTLFQPVPGQNYGGNRTLARGVLAAHGNGDWGLKIGRETMQPIVDFLDKDSGTPFFIWYAPFLPHQPHDAPQQFFELYENQPDIPRHRVPYYASISQFDETVGQLVQMIEERQLMQSTLFVFVIDNGWQASEQPERTRPVEFAHTKESKRSPFESGLRTPILFCWQSVIPPATYSEPVSSIDIVPTILDAVGKRSLAGEMAGMSLLSVAQGQGKLDPDRPIFGEIYPGDATLLGHPERDIAYRWMKLRNVKLIVPHQHDGNIPWNGYLNRPGFFDLEADPNEQRNLIDEPQYAAQVRNLRTMLDGWWDGETSSILLD